MLNLESLDLSKIENEISGKPLEISINDILEDENQPRFEFPEFEMQQLSKSISESGVKTPISVHHHPEINDKYVINHGHRRYRASIMAGKTTVPAFIDEAYTDYDQVMENKERLGHTPLEIAKFIQKKIEQGEKKNAIAEKLNETPVYISNHLALIDMPEIINKAYEHGCNSPKTIYELRNLYKKYPNEIQTWIDEKIANDEEITRTNVKNIGTKIKDDLENEKKLDKIFSKAESSQIETDSIEYSDNLDLLEDVDSLKNYKNEETNNFEKTELKESANEEYEKKRKQKPVSFNLETELALYEFSGTIEPDFSTWVKAKLEEEKNKKSII